MLLCHDHFIMGGEHPQSALLLFALVSRPVFRCGIRTPARDHQTSWAERPALWTTEVADYHHTSIAIHHSTYLTLFDTADAGKLHYITLHYIGRLYTTYVHQATGYSQYTLNQSFLTTPIVKCRCSFQRNVSVSVSMSYKDITLWNAWERRSIW